MATTDARQPIVGVMGSGQYARTDRCNALGRWLARAGFHLLTGGGGGAMAAVSQAFYEVSGRAGRVIGILPGLVDADGYGPLGGYPNPWVEIPIYTHLPLSGRQGDEPLSRNHINVLSSDVVVALAGSHGTASEINLALAYGRPVVAYLGSQETIPGLPPSVPVFPDLARVQTFVFGAPDFKKMHLRGRQITHKC